MDKKELMKAYPKYRECTEEEFENNDNALFIEFKDGNGITRYLFLKPKLDPVKYAEFENEDLLFSIDLEDGFITIEYKEDGDTVLLSPDCNDLKLLDKAIKKSKEIVAKNKRGNKDGNKKNK